MRTQDQHPVATERPSAWTTAKVFLGLASQPATVWRGIKIALIVTPVLTLINQFGAIVHHNFGAEFFLKLALTACVPFLVSVTSSTLANMAANRD